MAPTQPLPSREMTNEQSFLYDRLFEKHESMREEGATRRAIVIDGMPVTLLLPRYLPEIEIVTTSKCDALLFIIGRIQAPESWGVSGNGAVLVGRARADGAYAVHVWHELHRGMLEHLVG